MNSSRVRRVCAYIHDEHASNASPIDVKLKYPDCTQALKAAIEYGHSDRLAFPRHLPRVCPYPRPLMPYRNYSIGTSRSSLALLKGTYMVVHINSG